MGARAAAGGAVSSFRQTIEAVVLVIDGLGVLIIVLGIVFAAAALFALAL